MKIVIAILVGIIILGGGWWFHQWEEKQANVASTATTTTAINPPATPSQTGTTADEIEWSAVSAGEDATSSAPLSRVTFNLKGNAYYAGTYMGSCAEVTDLLPNEIKGTLCWFAGAGDEIGVFKEGGKLLIKHGEQQEPSGEGEAFRGNFKTLFTIE